MNKAKLYLLISFLLLVLIGQFVIAYPYIYLNDNWYFDGSSTTDGKIFTDYEVLPETLGITDADADMTCYDWNNDGRFDNCYWDSNGCGGGGCNANSCDWFKVALDMPDGWKAGCDVDGGPGACKIGEDVPSRICGTCDGVDTSTIAKEYINAEVYYDCDNSASNRHADSDLNTKQFYVMKPKFYDCDNTPYYDLEGQYSSSYSWDIVSDIQCSPSTKACDENHDDDSVYTANVSINDPCRTKDWNSCSSNSQCISDFCYGNECSPCGGNQCTSTYWNQCYNNGQRCCSGDPVNNQYFCDYDESWVDCTTSNHVDGQQKDSYTCSNAGGAWHWTTEDDLSSTQCDYYLSKGNDQSCDCTTECSGNYCWGNSVLSYQCKSSCTTEGQFSPTNQCCGGLQWDSSTKQCFNPAEGDISVSPSSLVFNI